MLGHSFILSLLIYIAIKFFIVTTHPLIHKSIMVYIPVIFRFHSYGGGEQSKQPQDTALPISRKRVLYLEGPPTLMMGESL